MTIRQAAASGAGRVSSRTPVAAAACGADRASPRAAAAAAKGGADRVSSRTPADAAACGTQVCAPWRVVPSNSVDLMVWSSKLIGGRSLARQPTFLLGRARSQGGSEGVWNNFQVKLKDLPSSFGKATRFFVGCACAMKLDVMRRSPRARVMV